MNVYVRELGTRKIVRTIEIISPNSAEKVVLGLLRNMNTDKFYVDDDEIYKESK